MELRRIPGLGRTLALPLASLLVAAAATGLAVEAAGPGRWLVFAAVSVGVFGVYELVRGLRSLTRQRRIADDWLRSATGRFVPASYAWRAEQLRSPRRRRRLAKTLRSIERRALEPPYRRAGSPRLVAVREHRASLLALVRTLERTEEPVSPAGVLRVTELVGDSSGPLWGTTRDGRLGEAISTTLMLLTHGVRDRGSAARSAC
jgi:hypothetical protein